MPCSPLLSTLPLISIPPFKLLVWGGSSAVGLYTIKLASLLGYKVVTTSSPHNFDLVKSRGASAVFAHSDADTPQKIKDWARGQGFDAGIRKGYDTISEKGSTKLVAESLAKDAKIVTICASELLRVALTVV